MRSLTFLLVFALAAFAACDDDGPAKPGDGGGDGGGTTGGTWVEVDLGIFLNSAQLRSVDCASGDCLALGYAFNWPQRAPLPGFTLLLYARAADGSWSPTSVDGLEPENYNDLALGAQGDPVLVGFGAGGSTAYAVLHDARTRPAVVIEQSPGGLLAIDGDGDFMVAGGASTGGLLWTSTAPGFWTHDEVPTTGTNDGGFDDVVVHGDTAMACGYDDGADTLQVILRRTKTTPWEHVNRNGLTFGADLECIEFTPEGSIYVGGIAEPGGPNARAFAAIRQTDGEWVSVVLTDAVTLGRVNDILIASDGSIYLACSGEDTSVSTAHLLRVTPFGITSEITPFDGAMYSLTEAGDGRIYAVGAKRRGATFEPKLFERTP